MKQVQRFLLIIALLFLVTSGIFAADINGEVKTFGSYTFGTGNFEYGSSLQLTYNPSLSSEYYLMVDTTLKYQSDDNYSPIRINELYLQGVATPSKISTLN